MRIVARYLITDVIKTFSALTVILLFVALSNRFVRMLAHAVAGELSPGLMLKLTGIYIPTLLVYLIPLSLFIGIVLTFSRAFVDQEIPVLFACGMSWRRLVKWCLSLSFVLVWVVAALSCYVVPKMEGIKYQILGEQDPQLILESLAPGRFHSLFDDKVVFYVEGLSSKRDRLKEVFIAEQPPKSRQGLEDWSVITAEAGQVISKENGQIYLELKNGARYNGVPGEKDYSVLKFERYGRLMEESTSEAGRDLDRTMPTLELLKSNKPADLGELQWRIALPLSLPILALLAVPLSQVSPRKGRFAKLLPAMILYMLYFNFLMVSKRWVDSGKLSPYIGMWWVHVMMFFIAMGCLLHVSGRLHMWRVRFFPKGL